MADPGDGVDAAAAGFDVPDGAIVLAADIDWWLRYGLDLLALRTTAGVTPVADGGTGANNPTGAKANLEIVADKILRPGGDTIETTLLYIGANYATSAALAAAVAGKASIGADVTFGHIFTPAGRSTPVVTSYVAAYLDSAGRIGATPSAAKYKRDVEDFDGSVLGLRAVTYVLKDDELGTVRLGIIADEADEVEPMLVVHEDGEPESFKYELLAVGLLKEVQRLAARVQNLEDRSE